MKPAIRTKEDEIYDGLEHLAFQINLMRKLYPKAMHQVFLTNNIRIENLWHKQKYKKAEAKELAMANLKIDLLKNQYANN